MAQQTANEALFDASVRRRIQVLRNAADTADRVLALLNASEQDLLARIAGQLAAGLDPGRLEALLRDVHKARDDTWQAVHALTSGNLKELAVVEAGWEASLVRAVVPVNLELASVSVEALRAVVASPIQGLPLAKWFDSLSSSEAQHIERAIAIGVTQGETIDQIVARVRGTPAAFYRDGIMDLSRRSATGIVRTAVNHVSNLAREEMWLGNSDIIAALRWTSVLDGRTSPICRARDGHFAALEGKDVPDGLPVLQPPGARPPAHFNCRSVMVALLDGVALSGVRPFVADDRTRRVREAEFRRDAKLRGVPIKTIRTEWADRVIGEVPADITYEQWLRRQSTSFQDDVLGPSHGQLFRGGTHLDSFVDYTGRRVSLDELRAMGTG